MNLLQQTYPLFCLLKLIALLSTVQCNIGVSSSICKENDDCGYKSECNVTSGACACNAGFSIHENRRDCVSELCQVKDCVDCREALKCERCVDFISHKTGLCMERCTGKAEIVYEGPFKGNVCSESDSESTDIVIAIVAGVAASLLLLIIITLGVFFYMRKTRKNVNLQEKNYKARGMEMGNVKHIPAYDNKGFEADGQVEPKVNVVDPDVYASQLEQLRPHTETLMTVLGQVRKKLRAMDENDPRVPTYKGVIHQLCRVLVLLHKKDSQTSIPSDALGLFEWAEQMLEDHRAQQEEQEDSNQDSSEPTVGRISYIDVDLENHPVYATPGQHHSSPNNDSIDTSGYYSSVPVPLGVSNNYATINRSPAHAANINRNIYSKTNNVKKYVNNVKGRANVPQMGYFSNGRYYDPNPNADVYAPTSSYSDRSTGPLSTFLSEKHRSRSRSTSLDAESDDDVDETEDEGHNDVFPFDPQEATDPVEV